jgi:hypothetical protein
MKKSLRIPLAMPGATALCALVGLAAVIGLTGCTDKHVTEVKALPFSYPSDDVQDPNMTVDQALDYRKVCDSVKWKVDETEQHQTFVEYNCDYKNVKNSSFIANNLEEVKVKNPNATGAVRVGDVYQWVYGADGKPVLSYVTLRYQFANGSSKDVTPYNIDVEGLRLTRADWMTTLMQQAVNNTAIDYDHLYSQFYRVSIPPMPETVMQAPTATQVTETRKEATTASRPGNTADSVAAAMASTAMTPPASAPIAAPVASPAAAPTTVAAGASPASSNVPIDDPADLAKMTALARKATATNPDDPSTSDGIIDGPFNPSGMNLQAGKPRPDGYPNYAVTCDFKANQCSFVNGMGQALQDTPEHLYSAAVTVVRNADALPGKYSCHHGLCIDSKGDLVGRLSAAMAQAHPELLQ